MPVRANNRDIHAISALRGTVSSWGDVGVLLGVSRETVSRFKDGRGVSEASSAIIRAELASLGMYPDGPAPRRKPCKTEKRLAAFVARYKTRKAAAKALGYSASSITHWLNGRQWSPVTRKRLNALLDGMDAKRATKTATVTVTDPTPAPKRPAMKAAEGVTSLSDVINQRRKADTIAAGIKALAKRCGVPDQGDTLATLVALCKASGVEV